MRWLSFLFSHLSTYFVFTYNVIWDPKWLIWSELGASTLGSVVEFLHIVQMPLNAVRYPNFVLLHLLARFCDPLTICFNLQVWHPVHNQTFYMDADQKRKFKEKYGEALQMLVIFWEHFIITSMVINFIQGRGVGSFFWRTKEVTCKVVNKIVPG